MNRRTFVESLASRLNGLQGKIEVREDYIFISSLIGDTSHLFKWLDGAALIKRYTVTEAKLVFDNEFISLVWECNGGMLYTVALENNTYIHVNICEVYKRLPQSAVYINADI